MAPGWYDREHEWSCFIRRSPQQLRSRQTLDRLLDAAEAVIREEGISELTVAKVVKRGQSSVGAFYRRFPDREALLFAVAGKQSRPSHTGLRRPTGSASPLPCLAGRDAGQALLIACAHGPEGRASASCIRDPGGHPAGLPGGGPEVPCRPPLYDDSGAAFISGRDLDTRSPNWQRRWYAAHGWH